MKRRWRITKGLWKSWSIYVLGFALHHKVWRETIRLHCRGELWGRRRMRRTWRIMEGISLGSFVLGGLHSIMKREVRENDFIAGEIKRQKKMKRRWRFMKGISLSTLKAHSICIWVIAFNHRVVRQYNFMVGKVIRQRKNEHRWRFMKVSSSSICVLVIVLESKVRSEATGFHWQRIQTKK